MPNHVTNYVELIGEQYVINELLEKVKYDNKDIGTLDFNKIIPMPEPLNIESGSNEDRYIKAYLRAAWSSDDTDYGVPKISKDVFERYIYCLNRNTLLFPYDRNDIINLNLSSIPDADKCIAEGKKYIDNLRDYGATTWYNWCIEHWGTKWNSYNELPFTNNCLIFDTAWSNVRPVMLKLSEMYPTVTIKYSWADEDIGSNVGEVWFLAGEIIFSNIPESDSREAYEMAARIKEEDLADYGLIFNEQTGTYEYSED